MFSLDVLEALEFIAICVAFKIDGSQAAFRKCLNLIWSKEQTVREAIVKAFQRLYLNSDERSVRYVPDTAYGSHKVEENSTLRDCSEKKVIFVIT